MGKARKAFNAFVDSIPDAKLTGFSSGAGTIYKDTDFRLDMQGMTTGSLQFNLQIQINKGTTITSIKGVAPKTVSMVLLDVTATNTAAEMRVLFKDNCSLA